MVCDRFETYHNFGLEIHLTINKGDCGGVVFHRSGYKLNLLDICQNGYYKLLRYVDQNGSTAQTLSAFVFSPLISM